MPELKDKMETLGNTARHEANKVAGQAKDAAASVVGAVKDTFQDVAGNAANMANKAASQVRDTAKEWYGAAEECATSTAQQARRMAGEAAERAGDVGDELTRVIQRNPIPCVLAAVGIGFLAAIALRRGSSS
jgi:gas vesicle protein